MNRSSVNRTLERSIQAGWFIHWQQQTYRVVSYDKADPFQLVVEQVVTGEAGALNLLQLLSLREGEPEPIFAPTLIELQQTLERRTPTLQPMTSTDLPDRLLAQADTIIALVQTVDRWLLEKRKFGAAARNRLLTYRDHQGSLFTIRAADRLGDLLQISPTVPGGSR